MAEKEGGKIQCRTNLFQSVPRECISSMIALTTPADACRLALVSRDFLAASESNFVWQRFLPADCDLIVARSDGGEALLAEFQDRKKQLYLRLADRPLLVDDASKSFWLDKSSGKKCWMIAASRDITLGHYWKWTSIRKSRFPELAELEMSSYGLNINGKIQSVVLSRGTQYAAYLVFKMTNEAYTLFDGHIVASVCIVGVEICKRLVSIDLKYETMLLDKLRKAISRSPNRRRLLPARVIAGVEIAPYHLGADYDPDEQEIANIIEAILNYRRLLLTRGMADKFPKLRTDGWYELKIGEFFVYPGEGDEVELSLRDARNTDCKRGLIVEGIEIRPAGA